MIFSVDATIPVIVVIKTTIPAVVSFGLSSFYSAATTTEAVLAVLVTITMDVIASGLSFCFYAVTATAMATVSANLQVFSHRLKLLYSESAAVFFRRSIFFVIVCFSFSYNVSKG